MFSFWSLEFGFLLPPSEQYPERCAKHAVQNYLYPDETCYCRLKHAWCSLHAVLTLIHLGWTASVDFPRTLQSFVGWDLFFAGESEQPQQECRARNLAQLGTGLLFQVFWGEMRRQNNIYIYFFSIECIWLELYSRFPITSDQHITTGSYSFRVIVIMPQSTWFAVDYLLALKQTFACFYTFPVPYPFPKRSFVC